MYVYFIQAGIDGPVKIGIAAEPEARRDAMQIGNALGLRLLAAVPGSVGRESDLHERFAAGRIRGEWFDATTPGLAEEIARAIDEELEFEHAKKVCEVCGERPVRRPRRRYCSISCSATAKRSATRRWKAARR